MLVFKTVQSMRLVIKNTRKQNKKIGFVPTMGALHAGHLSLIRRCRRENDCVVVSIFVNPKQFTPKEDFTTYPREEKKDILLAKNEKVDIIFCPSEKEMYSACFLTSIRVDTMTKSLCGRSRPGHFQGVVTVMGKLLNIVTPDTLYLGQKDAQQAIVLRRMIADLNFPVTVKVCPIVREGDGLAMSSRNGRLTPQQRRESPVLFESLKNAKRCILAGERDVSRITRRIRANLTHHSSGTIDYIACVEARSLIPLKRIEGTVMIALAVQFGKIRLIDNIIVRIS